MDLVTVQAALAELERQQKKLGNKIANRERQAADRQAEADAFKRELEALIDRHIELGAVERELKEEADA